MCVLFIRIGYIYTKIMQDGNYEFIRLFYTLLHNNKTEQRMMQYNVMTKVTYIYFTDVVKEGNVHATSVNVLKNIVFGCQWDYISITMHFIQEIRHAKS